METTTLETAGQLAHKNVPTAEPEQTTGEVLATLQSFAGEYDTVDYVYVLQGQCLVGVVSLHEILAAPTTTIIRQIMTTPVASVHTHTDQEHVAQLALAQSIKAVPVVDAEQQFVGVVPADVILEVLRAEHTEDLLKYAGLSIAAGIPTSQFTLAQHIASRLPWLILGLGGGVAAAWVVEHFAGVIAMEVALAAFIPAIVYLADAVGSQTQMMYVRSLQAPAQPSVLRVLGRELIMAGVIGAVLSVLIMAVAWGWLGGGVIATVLAIAVFLTVIFSVLVAILLPWFFYRAGKDPAIATGPLATVLRDVSSLCIYFLVAISLL